ncbi:hypothetical protein BDB00DRAFT_105961 [Zychaea mexicana]|uniref:uncharacterized protein n=1 Tax=Zychaea mexicana TaxID=64656 RepID=UPI0022FDFA87|nr:uncharacterized protein BDB00DRAFT_105961 [Zychaea mexicana]KAI9496735.1 hypothetical protein BDB00DRAFT_105961 [Zychaea mexicana]
MIRIIPLPSLPPLHRPLVLLSHRHPHPPLLLLLPGRISVTRSQSVPLVRTIVLMTATITTTIPLNPRISSPSGKMVSNKEGREHVVRLPFPLSSRNRTRRHPQKRRRRPQQNDGRVDTALVKTAVVATVLLKRMRAASRSPLLLTVTCHSRSCSASTAITTCIPLILCPSDSFYCAVFINIILNHSPLAPTFLVWIHTHTLSLSLFQSLLISTKTLLVRIPLSGTP